MLFARGMAGQRRHQHREEEPSLAAEAATTSSPGPCPACGAGVTWLRASRRMRASRRAGERSPAPLAGQGPGDEVIALATTGFRRPRR